MEARDPGNVGDLVERQGIAEMVFDASASCALRGRRA
jgi:hypothetical protein